MTGDLTGSWRGMFSYPGEFAAVAFEADLREFNGALTGLTHEIDDAGDGRGTLPFTAVIEGRRNGREVEFRKTYDDFNPICVVDYFGTTDADELEIRGEWSRLDDNLSGSFVMHRERSMEDQAELLAEVAVRSDR